MTKTDIIKDYVMRIVKLVPGLILCGLGNCFIIRANVGMGAWETFQIGISGITDISFGKVTIMVSFAIVLLDVFLKGKIGIGTILNAVLIGTFADVFLGMSFIHECDGMVSGFIMLIAGEILTATGTMIYMKGRLGCGPRDTLMVVTGKKFPRAPIGIVRFCLDIGVFIAGVIMGAPYGFGSILALTCFSALFQTVCKIFKFEPRAVIHDDFIDVVRKLSGKDEPLPEVEEIDA